SMSSPCCPSVQNASPLIFSSTRLYLGAIRSLLADFHALEAAEDQVLLERGDLRLEEIPVGALELILLGERHVEQALLGVEVLLHLALDDLRGDLGGLALDVVLVILLLLL